MKRKVSLVVSDLSKSGAGRWEGGGVRSFLLAQALRQIDYDVEIVGFVFDKDQEAKFNTEIPITCIRAQGYPKFLSSAKQLLDKLDGDIIYAMRPKPTSFGLPLIKKLNRSRPVILDIDDWEVGWFGGDQLQYRPSFKQLARDILKPNGALRFPDHPLYLKWMEGYVKSADAITVHTQFLQKRFGGVCIPNGKDTTLFDPTRYDAEKSRERYGLSGYRILMFPGAPRPYKGIEDVLIALDRLNEPDLRLAIVGGSPYDDYDEKLIQQWGRWIIKLPKFPVTTMPEVVAAAHIVVVPQRDIPAAVAQFPLKLTDGMAMGKPILATRVGDIPEILGGAGYLVDPSSPDQIAAKIQSIFQNFESALEQGKQARDRCVAYYSIDAMSGILSETLSKL